MTRQEQVASLRAEGKTHKQIAEELSIGVSNVGYYLKKAAKGKTTNTKAKTKAKPKSQAAKLVTRDEAITSTDSVELQRLRLRNSQQRGLIRQLIKLAGLDND